METCAIVDGSIHGDGGMDSDDGADGLVYKRVPYIKTVEHLWHTLKTCAIVDGSIHGDGGMDSDDGTDGARL